MHVGFQHVAVRLGADRLRGTVFFFFESRASGLDHYRVDLTQQLLVHMADVLRKGLVMKGLLLIRKHRAQAQDLPQQTIVIGQVFQPVVVTVQRQTHDPQDQNVPQIQTRSPGGLLAADHLLFQQLKNLAVDLSGLENPLQPRQHRRQFVPAPSRQHHFFNRGFTQRQLNLESFAHDAQHSLRGVPGQRIFEPQTALYRGFSRSNLQRRQTFTPSHTTKPLRYRHRNSFLSNTSYMKTTFKKAFPNRTCPCCGQPTTKQFDKVATERPPLAYRLRQFFKRRQGKPQGRDWRTDPRPKDSIAIMDRAYYERKNRDRGIQVPIIARWFEFGKDASTIDGRTT